jgi:hypothetical protein
MNKIIFAFIVLVVIPFNLFGQPVKSVTEIPKLKIQILSGNPKYYENAKSYHVQFDYSDLKIGGYGEEQAYIEYMKDDAERRKKGSSDNWLKKWYSYRTVVFQPKFIDIFKKYAGNKIKVDTVYKDQKFVLSLHTQFIEIGFNRNFKKSPTYISVTATLSEKDSSEKPLIISMENAIGNEVFSSYSEDFRRIEEAYAKCAKELATFMLRKIY